MNETIDKYVSAQAHASYGTLLPGFWFCAAAILLFFTALTLFKFVKGKNKEQHKTEDPVQRTFWILLCMILYLAVIAVNIPHTAAGITAFVLLTAAAVVSGAGMMRGLYRGIVSAFVFIWLGFFCIAVPDITVVYKDFHAIDSFAVSQMLPVYAAGDILLMRVLFLEIIAGILTVFIFESCRKMIRESGMAEEETKKPSFISSVVQDHISDLKSKCMAAGIVVLLVFIPGLFSNTPAYLSKGSAALNNAFTDSVKQFLKDPSVRESEGFKQQFNDSYSKLSAFDKRAFDINLRGIKASDMTFFRLQSEAAYQQLLAMDELLHAVDVSDSESASLAGKYFDCTNVMMMTASSQALGEASNRSGNIFRKFQNIVVDTFRFYVSFIPLWVLALLFISGACVLMISVGKSGVRLPGQKEAAALLRKKDSRICLSRPQMILTVLLLLLSFGSAYAEYGNANAAREQSYESLVKTAFVDSAVPVMQIIAQDPASVQKNTEQLTACLEAQYNALETFRAFKDVDKNYTELHNTLSGQAGALQQTIKELRLSAASGSIDPQLKSSYFTADMNIMKESMNIIVMAAIDAVSNLLG